MFIASGAPPPDLKETWDAATEKGVPASDKGVKRPAGKPSGEEQPAPPKKQCRAAADTALVEAEVGICPFCAASNAVFRVCCIALLLTWNGLQGTQAVWDAFKDWVRQKKKGWGLLFYSATMETCKGGRPHIHMMLQFRKTVDMSSAAFAFQGARPNVRPTWTDLNGEGFSKKIFRKPRRRFLQEDSIGGQVKWNHAKPSFVSPTERGFVPQFQPWVCQRVRLPPEGQNVAAPESP